MELEVGSSLEEWRENALADLVIAAEDLDERSVSRCTAMLASPPKAWNGALSLVHGDLAAEHVLLDDALRPTGVIDSTDMMWSSDGRHRVRPSGCFSRYVRRSHARREKM
ncbi:MAG: hypothetical protein JWP87_4818 [Labilithrix sp.]|nr:hypothetical protein [Labilithrix sp.]